MIINKEDCDVEFEIKAYFKHPKTQEIIQHPKGFVLTSGMITNQMRTCAKLDMLNLLRMELSMKEKDFIEYIQKHKWLDGEMEV